MLDIARKALLLLALLHGQHSMATEASEALLSPGHGLLPGYLEDDSLGHGITMKIAGVRDDWQEKALQLEFHDSSTIGKIRRIRGLSLLTLAETRQSKLFLGISRRGLLGLHFSSSQPSSTDRVLEIARMPYLARDEAVAAVSP